MTEPAAKQRQMINLDEFERRLGRPAVAPRSGEDPLAELARLVGGTEDRFKNVFQSPQPSPGRAPADPQWGGRQNADWLAPQPREAVRYPLSGDFASIEAGLRGSIAPDFQADAEEAYADAEDDEDWLDTPYSPMTPASVALAEPPRSRLPLYATAAIIIVGILGIGGTFALKRSPRAPHEIAMIKAAAGPTKIQASTSTDGAKPNQDASILDKSPQPTPVALVNRVEQPVDLKAQTPPAPTGQVQVASAGPSTPSGAAVVPVPPPPAIDATSGQSFGLAGMIEPKMVKTVSVRPDGTLVSSDPSPQQAMPANPPAVAPAAAAPPPPEPAATAAKPATPKTAARVATTPKTVTADATPARREDNADDERLSPTSTKPKASPAKPAKVAEAATTTDETDDAPPVTEKGGTYSVQLAAPESEAEARVSMTKLTHQFGSELANYHLRYHLASIGNKSVYRVRVGGLSHAEATTLCEKVQAKGGNCFVAKN